jgi:hypothetical protein
LAKRQEQAGPGGRYHEQAKLDDLQKAIDDAKHAKDLFQWHSKKPKHPSEGKLNEGYLTPEDDEASGENLQQSEYADGFRAFCEYRGLDPYVDGDLAAGLIAWARKVGSKRSPYNPDIEGVAEAVNPYVLDQVKTKLPPNFLAAVQAEIALQQAPPVAEPLTEGLQVILSELIREQVEQLLNPDTSVQ